MSFSVPLLPNTQFLTVDVKAEPEAIPAQDNAEDFIETCEVQVIGTARTRITMGLTLRNTARRTNRLKDVCVFIPRGYDEGFKLSLITGFLLLSAGHGIPLTSVSATFGPQYNPTISGFSGST